MSDDRKLDVATAVDDEGKRDFIFIATGAAAAAGAEQPARGVVPLARAHRAARSVPRGRERDGVAESKSLNEKKPRRKATAGQPCHVRRRKLPWILDIASERCRKSSPIRSRA